jgi:Peptidase family S41
VTHWNGAPIDRAVITNANRFAGSNMAARLARGVESLTIRSLRMHLPPDEEWVTVTYIGTDGIKRELRESWLVAENLPPMADMGEVTTTATALGLDLDADETGRAKTLLFAPHVVATVRSRRKVKLSTKPAEEGAEVASTMPTVFRARSVATASGTFGHVRIFTFSVDDPDAFVAEFVRLIELLPQNGLIVDVRGNGGGHIYASEFTLQTLTARRIVPEPVQFINTPINLAICRQHATNPTGQIDLGPWFASIEQSVETGAAYSGAFPITPEEGANAIGQRYHGPVVLITDARCYSATDIFAAGFQDHRIGPVLGVDDNTGAGGANVWTHGLLKTLLEVPTQAKGSPYKALPKQADMRVAIRRTLRVGTSAGTPVEDLGVVPDERHRITKRDVLEGNVDLLDRAGELLAALPVRRLTANATLTNAGKLTVAIDAQGLDRADVFVDGRPRATQDIGAGAASITVSGMQGATSVRIEGYSGDELVACRTVTI